MRSWLNGYEASVNQPETDYSRKNFINSAFTSTQRSAIKTTSVVNDNSNIYGTESKNNIADKVFLLANSKSYNKDVATSYGFDFDNDVYGDEARRSRCSAYAYAMGTERCYPSDDDEGFIGNVSWWYYMPDRDWMAISVDFDGQGEGVGVERDDIGVRPALHINLSSTNLYSYAGTVCSDAMKSGRKKPDYPSEPDEPDTPNQPTQPDKPGTATGTRTEGSNVDIEIDGGVDFTIPDNVPILGGGDVSLDYGKIPITFKREDNTYRIGIGVQDMNKKDWTTFKSLWKRKKNPIEKE